MVVLVCVLYVTHHIKRYLKVGKVCIEIGNIAGHQSKVEGVEVSIETETHILIEV